MKRVAAALFLLGVLAVFYFSLPGGAPADSVSRDNGLPQYGGTLTIGVAHDIDSFNPLYTQSKTGQEVNHLFLLGLADLNDKAEFVPELASRWQKSDDNLSITFHLKKGLQWSDGVPLSAHDVGYTYELKMDTTVGSPRIGETEFIKKVSVLDSFTVRFEFKEAYPEQMFDVAGEILPAHLFRDKDRRELRTHTFGTSPISSGPFLLKNWVRQQYVEVVPNPNYHGERPYLDRVVFKIIPDQSSGMTQLRTGEIDMLLGVPPEKVRAVKKAMPGAEIHRIAGRSYYYLGYNCKDPLFKDPAVRRALTMATDRQKLIDALLFGYGSASYGPIPPIIPWAYTEDVEKIAYSTDAAADLLAKAGWRDSDGDGWLDKKGKRFEFDLLLNTGNQLRADLAVIMQSQLKKVGVKVNLQTAEWTAYLDRLAAKQMQAYLGGWGAAFTVDPTPLFHSKSTDMFNYVGYANPVVDKMIEQGRAEMSQAKRAVIWKKVQQQIYKDQPYNFLFWREKLVATAPHVRNATPIALSSIYNLEQWYLAARR